ncbi:MAG: TonB-dependent receptor [Bacteroidales bacterium]|nr:TonB-dependent receptor [Bacteroidales bacterium]
MKKSVLLFCLFLVGIDMFPQELATVSGRIFDNSTGEPLPYATVTMNAPGEQDMIAGVIAGEDGRFVISGLNPGEYVVNCSFIGYVSAEISLLVGDLNRNFDLGRIGLEPSSSELDEVVVEAKKAVISADLDRKTYNIEDNLIRSGGSVLEAMKGLPGITVDQEGRVMLRGSDKVAVLIDGQQSSLTGFGNQKGLDNIPVSNIEAIEIINNPSARYLASGMAGIVNIIYKKEEEKGFNGDAGFTFGIGPLSRRKADLPTQLGSYAFNPKYIPSLNLNYKAGRINTFFQGELLRQKKLPNNEFTTRNYDDGQKTASQVPENRRQTHYILKAGIDWMIGENDQLSLSGIYDYESHYDTAQVPYINMNTLQRYRYWNWLEWEITGFMNYALQYERRFVEPGHELKANVQYTKGWEDESYYLNDSSMIRTSHDTTHIIATEHTTSLSVDYVKPLRSGRLEAGTRVQVRRIPVTYTVGRGEQSIIYPGLGEWSKWGENIYAGYLNYVYEGSGLDIEAGLRAENTDVYYNLSPENIYYEKNDSYQYFELFPNIRLTFKINERNSLSVFYNRRVDRPGEPELRVFPKYDDPELLKVGNPYLRPQFTQTVELAYKYLWNSGSVFLSVYHRKIKDPFTRVYGIDTTNVLYDVVNKIYQNTGKADHTGFELILSQQVGSLLNLNASLNWYNNVIRAYKGTMLFPYERPFNINKTSDNTWDCKVSGQLSLPGQLQVQLTGVYYAPANIAQGRQYARSSVDLGVRKTLFEGKGEFLFSFSDLLNRFGIKQKIQGEGFTALYENYYETQVVSAGFKYKF